MSVIRGLGMAGQLTSRNFKDLGNTNYSIMVPRTSFQRRPNAELVARAVSSIGPPAEVNERNDIVVDGFKMSFAPLDPLAGLDSCSLVITSLDQHTRL